MRKIALLPNPLKDPKFELSRKIAEYLAGRGIEVLALPEFEKFVPPGVSILSEEAIFKQADAVISLGGDGTLLRIAKPAALAEKPILGINCGKIGYMAELEYSEITKLDSLISGDYKIERRLMLDVRVEREGKCVFSSVALNDAVVSKGTVARLIDLRVSSNGEEISAYRADGIIVSTPTGSTGYSLSAGGPVLEPTSDALIVTPICCHSLGVHPIVFAADSALEISPVRLVEQDAYLTVDGYDTLRLAENDRVLISRSNAYTRLIKIKDVNFYKILNYKLSDGGQNL